MCLPNSGPADGAAVSQAALLLSASALQKRHKGVAGIAESVASSDVHFNRVSGARPIWRQRVSSDKEGASSRPDPLRVPAADGMEAKESAFWRCRSSSALLPTGLMLAGSPPGTSRTARTSGIERPRDPAHEPHPPLTSPNHGEHLTCRELVVRARAFGEGGGPCPTQDVLGSVIA
jgi:hypothetical protein